MSMRVEVLAKGTKKHTWSVKKVTTLEDMQKLVGGYIERVPLPHNIDLWVNEEGVMNEHSLNLLLLWEKETSFHQPIYGPVFLASSNNEGELANLTDSQRYWIARNIKIAHLNDGETLTAIDLSGEGLH